MHGNLNLVSPRLQYINHKTDFSFLQKQMNRVQKIMKLWERKIISVNVDGKGLKLSRGMVSELQKLDQQREYLYSLRLLSLIM